MIAAKMVFVRFLEGEKKHIFFGGGGSWGQLTRCFDHYVYDRINQIFAPVIIVLVPVISPIYYGSKRRPLRCIVKVILCVIYTVS